MKTQKRILISGSTIASFYLLLLTLCSCGKTTGLSQQPQKVSALSSGTTAVATSNSNLIAYKNSNHHIFVGYLVADGADPVASYNPANSPDSVDFLEFFAGRDANRADWRTAQAKGTRIVVCHFLSDAYFDGSTQDGGSGGTTPKSTSTYNHWAQAMYQQHIVNDSLDGIDIDIESGTLGSEVANATNAKNVLIALSKYFGPNSTSALTVMGKKPVFFFDTDGSIPGGDGPLYTNYKTNYDYVLFQSYTTGNHYWSGSGTQSFSPLVQTYGLNKLIFLVNGDTFTSSNTDATTTSLLSYAQWVKTNNGTGVGAYRMSRDYNHTPPFYATRSAIQIMNPAAN